MPRRQAARFGTDSAALESVSPEPATARITAVELTVLGRHRQMHERETHAHLPLA
ncbi:hypothetical protein [Streptomyces sp. NBC_00829]|uniref:hypothetical protein n=1 Tax=Streptomyces sp. NBC_00829 TaxID=2903679 RepID=UPI003869B3D5|nr:hypothetical protein OG293_37125 [Streptomyces sp. NBC_00829]